ncbi:MAG: dual specificity protein phosphatase family protein [Saprospirales bacterium]|nr:dual specificity protein phosphatase family protein [Saprospirales bacterium]MBK8492824.1 dual specificity protein phosphatase family protein [Saprospirales bacterium]
MTKPIHPKVFWIQEPETAPGQLGMMPRPQGGDKLEADIKGLKDQGLNILVCLVEAREQKTLDLTAEARICAQYGIKFYHFPIPDFGVPNDNAEFVAFIHLLSGKLDEGRKVVVHCHGGIGRSSLAVAGVLVDRGVPVAEVFEKIRRHRAHRVPETREQAEWFAGLHL